MVRKLIKYDFASYMRLVLPVQLILIGIAALNRIVQLFEVKDSTVYNIVFYSSVVLYCIAIIVCFVLTAIVAIVRFYQGMYSNEGYLSHTLPVTPAQHITSKLIVSVLFMLGSLLAVFISLNVVTLGELGAELYKAGFFLLGRFFDRLKADGVMFIIEFMLMCLISAVAGLLQLYFCISVGQLAKKKKILLAFGVYFALYTLAQVLGTVIIIVLTLNPDFVESIGEWAEDNTEAFMHIVFCLGAAVSAIIGAVYFLLNRWIMSKKLNLT